VNPRSKNHHLQDQIKAFIPQWVFILALLIGALALIFWELKNPSSSRLIPDVYITEIAATGQASIRDEDGDLSSWIEISNFDTHSVHLEGWKLTDNFKHVSKWSFPPITLLPGERIVVFASGKDRSAPNRRLHTNFKLDNRGEYLALYLPNGQTAVNEILPKYPHQHGPTSWGLREGLQLTGARGRVPADAYRFFSTPTPGTPNRDELYGHVADVKVAIPSSLRNSPLDLTLSCRTPGARIFFTTNGSLPSPNRDPLYSSPLRIESSTVVRAIAARDGWAPSEVLTRSFIFPKTVLNQTGTSWPITWGQRDGVPVTADYDMDPEIVNNPAYTKDLLQGLHELPTVSIVANPHDLFDSNTGIYSNPMETGTDWERPASFEIIQPSDAPGVQVPCGIRIQGGWNRRPEECPKHSLRVLFKSEYGEPKLSYPIFGRAHTTEFDTLILRGGCNNSWLHWSGEERIRGDYARDEWMRQTSAAMGQPAARGQFVHVYINGLYWGLYNLTERPSAEFIASRSGGTPNEFDSRNAEKVLSGDNAAWVKLFQILNAGVPPQSNLDDIRPLLDLPNFCDYMLLNFYGANADWDRSSNWYAARRSNPPGPFQFLIWDGERTLEDPRDNRMDFDDDLSPPRIFHKLSGNRTFQSIFQERVRLHCSPGGVLSPEATAHRFTAIANQLQNAIVAESARWGDYRRDVHPYKTGPYLLCARDTHWRPEISRLQRDYFPLRTSILIKQLRQRGLAPSDTSQH